MTTNQDNQWNLLPQHIRDDMLKDIYNNIASKCLQDAQKELQPEKPKHSSRHKKAADEKQGGDGNASA